MAEKGLKAAKILPIEGGELINLDFRNNTWTFEFANQFVVESYGGWRILLHDHGGKTLAGSRDFVDSENPFAEINQILEGFSLGLVNFNELSDTTQLQLANGNDRITLDLYVDSARRVNWKFTGQDFEDSDQSDLLKNL